MPQDLGELTTTATRALVEATSKLGSKLREDGVVDLGWGDLFVRPVALQVQEPPEGIMLALGFEVLSPALLRPIRDIAVGIASSAEGAVQIGLQAFLGGPLAVLRDALGDEAAPYRYAITQTHHDTGTETQWSIFESALQIGGDAAARTELQQGMLEKPLFVRLAEAKALPPLRPGHVHVLKMHAARDGDRPAFYECAFDSEPWPEGQNVLAAFAWPNVSAPQTFRQYWVFTVN